MTNRRDQANQHDTVAEELRRRYESLTPTERKPAHTLLANYPFAGLETVARFAARAGVSGPTILRLVGKIGFSGYAEFQRKLREELQAQLQSPLARPPKAGSGRPGFLGRFGEAVANNIRQTIASVHSSEFNAVVDLLCDARRPVHLIGGRFSGALADYLYQHLIGGRFSGALADYLYQHLHTLRPDVRLVAGPESSWRNHLLDTGRRHVLVVFDIRRYQPDVIRFAEESAGRGATVVLFTDQWLSPVSGVAKHLLTARIAAPSRWDSTVAMMTLVEAVIALASEKLWPSASQRVAGLDQMLNPPAKPGKT